MTEKLRGVLSQTGDTRPGTKTSLTNVEIDSFVWEVYDANHRLLTSGTRELTQGDIIECHQFYSISGNGCLRAKQYAGGGMEWLTTTIKEDIRSRLTKLRDRIKLPDPLDNESISQINSVTLDVYNKNENTSLTELPDNISVAIKLFAETSVGQNFFSRLLKY